MTDLVRLEASLRAHEGAKDGLYLCPADKLSIAVGRNLEARPFTGAELRKLFDAKEIKITLTDSGISRVLAADMESAARLCKDYFEHWYELNDARQNAVAELCFQLGFNGLSKFKRFAAAVGIADWAKAKAELLNSRWARQTQKARVDYITGLIETGEWP